MAKVSISMKITIIGLPGSGKSTLARMVAEKLSIPHIHIDRFWFEAGGRKGSYDTPEVEKVRAYVKEKVTAAISGNDWVSDGFYSRVQSTIASRADVIIFLDVPFWQRFLNHATRSFRRSERHAEVSMWDDLKFFPEIVRRGFSRGPKLRSLISQFKDKVVTLRSRREINEYVNNLEN